MDGFGASEIVDGGSEVYGQPPAVQQKAGPYPLGQSLKNKLNLLNSNDDRMQQVVYSGGRTWSGLNTVVKTSNGPTTATTQCDDVDRTTRGDHAVEVAFREAN